MTEKEVGKARSGKEAVSPDIRSNIAEKQHGDHKKSKVIPRTRTAEKAEDSSVGDLKMPEKTLVQHDLTSYETPCVCSRLVDPFDRLSGWDEPPSEGCSCKQVVSRTKKPMAFTRLYQRDNSGDFVFKHYADSRRYIEQYRRHHTKGSVKPEADGTPVLGYDAPDPYLPKLRSIRARFTNDAAIILERTKSFTGADKKGNGHAGTSDDKRRRFSTDAIQVQSTSASFDRTSPGSSQSPSSGDSDNLRPLTTSRYMEDINLAPTRERSSVEKKQYSEVQSYMDLQTPRASFPLPVRIVEDYSGVTGTKARLSSPKHRPKQPMVSPRTSNAYLQDTIALMQKLPENQTNISNMILNAISDPNVYQHYLAKLKKIENGQPGAFLVGTAVTRHVQGRQKRPTISSQSNRNVQLGLCEVYSSGPGMMSGPFSTHHTVRTSEKKSTIREPSPGPLSKLDIRGCQYKTGTKTLPKTRKVFVNGAKFSRSSENE